ncbi:hypothetical protein [Deinococcus pimensis]|uniref:hypothetical protein n=1 Tax=Deinococcus pimensis TaxID=309888 RepID=UPI0004B7185D|nr:hypothetical protein [Deinococcus pimensis]
MTSTPLDLATVPRGELAKVFALPENRSSFVTVGQVPTGTPLALTISLRDAVNR